MRSPSFRPALVSLFGLAAAVAAVVLALSSRYDGYPQPPAAATASAPQTVAELPPVAIRVVRRDAQGDMVVAGRAAPGAEIVVGDGTREVGRAQADPEGEWVLIPSQPLSPGLYSLRAAAVGGALTAVDEPVILLVPAQPRERGFAYKPHVEGGGAVLPADAAAASGLEIAYMEWDAAGAMAVGGHAPPGMAVQLHLDGRFLGRVPVAPDGSWAVLGRLPAKAGNIIRAELVDEARNKVRGRAEAAYDHEPLDLAAAGTDIKVERRKGRWCLARRTVTRGMVWTVVYGG